jgi:hypothetical protein
MSEFVPCSSKQSQLGRGSGMALEIHLAATLAALGRFTNLCIANEALGVALLQLQLLDLAGCALGRHLVRC